MDLAQNGLKRVARLGAVAATIAAGVLAGCMDGESGGGEDAGAVRIGVPYPIAGIAPVEGAYDVVHHGMAETLMRAMPDGSVVGWLARSMSHSSDMKTWTVQLREGIRFHNGSRLDAKAAVAALQHMQRARELPVLSGASLRVTGPLVFDVELAKPSAVLPAVFADRYDYPIFDVEALPRDTTDAAAVARARIYTGAFVPEAPTPTGLTAKANPRYWGGDVLVPGIELRVVEDGQARVAAVEAGDVDVALEAPAAAAQGISDDVRLVTAKEALVAQALMPHVTEPPLDDVRVRQAIGFAIDYERLAEEVLDGSYLPARGLFSPSLRVRSDDYAFDLRRANARLDAAGWRRAEEGAVRQRDGRPLRLVLAFDQADTDAGLVATALKDMLAAVGIDLALQSVESTYEPDTFPRPWHLALRQAATFGVNNSPVLGIDNIIGPGGPGEVDEPELSRLLAEIDATAAGPEHDRLLSAAQAFIWQRGLAWSTAFAVPKAIVSREWAGFELPPLTPAIEYDVGSR